MANVRVKITVEITRILNPRLFRRAMEMAARKGGTSGNRAMMSEAKKAVREVKAMKAGAVARALTTSRQGRRIEDQRYSLNVANRPTRVADYRHRQTKTGVSARINRGKLSRIPRAFIARMPSGHKGVFKRRKDAKRLPVDEQMASRVLDAMSKTPLQNRVRRVGGNAMRTTMKRVLPHEVERLKSRARRR